MFIQILGILIQNRLMYFRGDKNDHPLYQQETKLLVWYEQNSLVQIVSISCPIGIHSTSFRTDVLKQSNPNIHFYDGEWKGEEESRLFEQ